MPCGNIFYLFFRNQVRKELDIVRPCWQYHGEHRRFLLNFYWYSHMNRNDPTDVQPILISKHVELQPLQREHIAPLLEAAEDGQLWNNKWTLVPDAKKIDSYIDTALAGRLAKTMMPFAITRRDTGQLAYGKSTVPTEPLKSGIHGLGSHHSAQVSIRKRNSSC